MGIDLANPAKSDKRMVAALGYLFTPMVPIVAMRGDDVDAFTKRHARQALLWAVPFLLLLIVMVIAMIAAIRTDLLFICLLPFMFLVPFVPGAYWARRVYFGGDVRFPFVNDA